MVTADSFGKSFSHKPLQSKHEQSL